MHNNTALPSTTSNRALYCCRGRGTMPGSMKETLNSLDPDSGEQYLGTLHGEG